MKSSMDILNFSLDLAEERINELEDRCGEIMQKVQLACVLFVRTLMKGCICLEKGEHFSISHRDTIWLITALKLA